MADAESNLVPSEAADQVEVALYLVQLIIIIQLVKKRKKKYVK